MEQRALGRSGVEVSRIILGCGNFGGIGSAPAFFGAGETEDEAHALLDAAWEAGITDVRHRRRLRRRPERVVHRLAGSRLPTCATDRADDEDVQPDERRGRLAGSARRGIRRQLETSLERLGVDAVDLYLPHAMDAATPVAETIGAFEELAGRGRSAPTGGSNVDADWLEEALGTEPAWVQNSYSLLDRDDEADVLPIVAREGLGYTPFSPLAGGWLTGKYRRGEEPPAGSRMTLRPEPYAHLQDGRVFDALEAFEANARERGTTPAALAMRLAARPPARHRRRDRPAPPRAPRPALEALELDLSPPEREQLAGCSHERARPRRARGAVAADDGRVHRGDGRGAALAGARRAAPAAAAGHAAGGLRHADGPDARLPRRRASAGR